MSRALALMHQFVRKSSTVDNYSLIVASFPTLKSPSASHCSGIFSVPLRIVSNGCDLNTVFSTSRHQAVARYELPVICLVSAGLACDNYVFAMIFNGFSGEAARRMSAVRIVRVLPVESSASVCRVVSYSEDN